MDINGLQKMTLLDFPGKVACTVFLAGCNFRCPFCHNSELFDLNAPIEMSGGAFTEFLKKRRGLLDGVAITGGEPLFTRGVFELMADIKEQGFPVKLDTNGAYPDRLREAISKGLCDYVAMDIKNSPDKYAQTIGFEHFDISPILESISILLSSGVDYEFRTTVVNELHDDDSIRGAAELIKGANKWFLQPFSDRDTVLFSGFSAPPEDTLRRWAEIGRNYVNRVEIRGV